MAFFTTTCVHTNRRDHALTDAFAASFSSCAAAAASPWAGELRVDTGAAAPISLPRVTSAPQGDASLLNLVLRMEEAQGSYSPSLHGDAIVDLVNAPSNV